MLTVYGEEGAELMNKGLKIRAFRILPRLKNIGIFIEEESSDGQQLYIAEPLVMKRHDTFSVDPPATVSLTPTAAQQLIDDLWDCGLRPERLVLRLSGSAGQLAATERHLKDMQTLVFKPNVDGSLNNVPPLRSEPGRAE